MKLYDEDISGSKNKRALLAVSLDEIEILLGLLNNAYRHSPKGVQFDSFNSRLRNMMNAMKKYIDTRKFHNETAPLGETKQ